MPTHAIVTPRAHNRRAGALTRYRPWLTVDLVSTDGRRATGALGERLAAERLEARGYRVLARNARTRLGEIDLIAVGNGCLVFCEVRARVSRRSGAARARDAGGPLESIGPQKRGRLRRVAREWVASRASSDEAGPGGFERLRFDAIGVILDRDGTVVELEHVEDAF